MPIAAEAGMQSEHETATANVARRLNTFIFVRPSTPDTARLIRHGYPTKSMDIHDKSSDWGPMAGFVPVNPAFDKKRGLSEGRAAFTRPDPARDNHDDHLQATTCQLFLKPALLAEYETLGKIVREPGRWQKPASGETVPLQGSAADSDARRYSAVKDGITFHFYVWKDALGWLVWYEDAGTLSRFTGGKRVNPLKVWAYRISGQLEPLTGDYDLWMVAPFRKSVGTHNAATLVADPHGASEATPFITALIPALNAECNRVARPVYRHGAESQNYSFTQAIDTRLAMFTPTGGSKMVERSEMPVILNDIRNRGYLVYINKRYLEADPRLMDKPMSVERRRDLEALRKSLHRAAQTKRAWVEQRHNNLKNNPKANPQARFRAAVRFAVSGTQAMAAKATLGADQADIVSFSAELLQYMQMDRTLLHSHALTETDFPQKLGGTETETRTFRRVLEAMVVEIDRASEQTAATARENLARFLDTQKVLVDKLLA